MTTVGIRLTPPSDDIVLRCGAAVARLRCNAGGRLVSLRLADREGQTHEVLYPYPDQSGVQTEWAKGGLFALVPYSNRLAEGKLHFRGDVFDLPPHPSVAPHTLHGNAHLQVWTLQGHTQDAATLVLNCPASPHWPWNYQARLLFALESASDLRIQVSLTNSDHRPSPAGIGLHPYLMADPNSDVVHDATSYWPTSGGLPNGLQPLPVGDLAERPDTLHLGGWRGYASVALASGGRVTLRASEALGHLVIHRPPQGGYLCIEPTSHVVNGFNLANAGAQDTGDQQLLPGASLEGELMITLGR